VLDSNTVVQQTFPGQRASIRVSDVRMGGPKSGKVCCTTVSLSSPGVCMRVRAVRLLSTKAPFLYYIAVSSGHEYQVAMKSYKPYTSCTPSPTLPRGTNIGQRCYRSVSSASWMAIGFPAQQLSCGMRRVATDLDIVDGSRQVWAARQRPHRHWIIIIAITQRRYDKVRFRLTSQRVDNRSTP